MQTDQGTALINRMVGARLKLPNWIWLFFKMDMYANTITTETVPGIDGGAVVYTPLLEELMKQRVMKELKDANAANFRRKLDDAMDKVLYGEVLKNQWRNTRNSPMLDELLSSPIGAGR